MGRNVAAGMTGGLAYILDEDDTFIPKVCGYCLFFSVLLAVLLGHYILYYYMISNKLINKKHRYGLQILSWSLLHGCVFFFVSLETFLYLSS